MSCRLMYATATVRARSFWTCDKCGKVEKGSNVTLERSDNGVGTDRLIFDQSTARSISAHSMPVGWSSYGKVVIRCGDCAL